MYEALKQQCKQAIPISATELSLLEQYFKVKEIKKKEFLLQSPTICNFLAFIVKGSIRHFHVKNGEEKTCDLSFENAWVTDFKSFNQNTPAIMNLQAMENTTLLLISRQQLNQLYAACAKFETFGRLMAEQVAQRATDMAMSFSADKPEERFQSLIKNQSNLFQRVAQKHIASFLGISAESLSRIRSRVIAKEKS